MIRRILCLGVTFATLMALCGCDPLGKPSLNPEFGIRVTDGKLMIWTGSACRGTTAVDLTFNMFRSDETALKLTAIPLPKSGLSQHVPPNPGIEVEYFTVGGPYSGFDVETPLPPGFDWRAAETVSFSVAGGHIGRGSTSKLADAIKESGRHPADTYWFQGVGWLSPQDIGAQDGRKFLALCTPNPAQDRHLPRVFGVRVTDGALRIWPGQYCGPVGDVIVTFQPAKADLVLTGDARKSLPFDSLTATGPYPGFDVVRALPSGFDWRMQKTVLLRVYRTNGDPWTTTTDLGPAVAESSQHTSDTYWFQGFGWLSPADVAGKDGKDLLTACAPEPARR